MESIERIEIYYGGTEDCKEIAFCESFTALASATA
jgi:hypothetical protein